MPVIIARLIYRGLAKYLLRLKVTAANENRPPVVRIDRDPVAATDCAPKSIFNASSADVT
jgi:hypothetical protein